MTRGRLVAAALALSLVVGLGGCSDDDETPASGAAGSTSTTAHEDADGDDGHGHTEPTLVDPKTGKQGRIREGDIYTAAEPPPASFRNPDRPPQLGDLPLTVKITPPCVEHGQELTAAFKSDPGATVAAQVKWPNDQFSGLDSTRGTTAEDGTLTWRVLVKPTALIGEATLMAAAIDERNTQRAGTSGVWQFVVAPPGRC